MASASRDDLRSKSKDDSDESEDRKMGRIERRKSVGFEDRTNKKIRNQSEIKKKGKKKTESSQLFFFCFSN